MARPRVHLCSMFRWKAFILLSFMLVENNEGVCPAKESEALLDLKAASQTTYLASWKLGSDCCRGWAGVSCNANATHVINLSLTENLQLALANISEDFCNLQFLEVLNISAYRWNKVPSCFWNLMEMRSLTIMATADVGPIEYQDSPQVCNLIHLTHLHISGTGFLWKASTPDCLWKMTKMEYIDLPEIYVSRSFTSQICSFSNIMHLVVQGGGNAEAPSCLWKLSKLQYLSLSSIKVSSSEIGASDECNLPDLRALSMHPYAFPARVPSCIWKSTKLEVFNLGPPSVDWQASPDMCNLKALSNFNVFGSVGRGRIPACIWNLTSLQSFTIEFSLDYSVVSSWGVFMSVSLSSQLCSLSNLRVLSLFDLAITGVLPGCIWNMTQLTDLSLSGTGHSHISVEVPNVVYAPSLTKLYLSLANMSGDFLSAILSGNLSSLYALSLPGNDITAFPDKVQNLSALSYIDLSSNKMTALPHWFQNLSQSLALVDLSYNLFKEMPPSLMALGSSLQILALDGNCIESIPPNVVSLRHLAELHLSNNPIQDMSDLCHLHGLPMLQSLSLSSITNSSNLPFGVKGQDFQCLKNLSQISDLDLSANNISDDLSTLLSCSIQNLTRIFSLNLSNNSILGNLSTFQDTDLQLQVVDLSSNQLTGTIPGVLLSSVSGGPPAAIEYAPAGLNSLNLSRNQLQGPIPDFNVGLLVREVNLDLSWNQLQGLLPRFPSSCWVGSLVLSNNQLTGPMPPGLQNWSTILQVLDLSYNNFSGEIPASLGRLKRLQLLDLTSNELNGSLPDSVGSCWSLQHLRVANNSLDGELPNSIGNIGSALVSLKVSYNDFEGPIPSTLGSCTSLNLLDLSHNRFSGQLPFTLENLSASLRVLTVASNHLTGPFPAWIESSNFTFLQLLDISSNSFYGSLPSDFSNLSGFTTGSNSNSAINLYADSVDVSTKGGIITISYNVTVRTSFDVHNNRFSGLLPKELGMLRSLKYLTVYGNAFWGQIPAELSNLHDLESLDLSANSFSNTIPLELSSILGLSYFNVSDNFLMGPIPVGSQFDTFNETFFRNNSGLCTLSGFQVPLPRCRNHSQGNASEPYLGRDCQNFHCKRIWISTCVAFVTGTALVLLGALLAMILWRRRRAAKIAVREKDGFDKLVTFIPDPKFSPSDILAIITDNNVIGTGAQSIVYSGLLPGGNVIAIKTFVGTCTFGEGKDFEGRDLQEDLLVKEAKIQSMFRHRNVVKVIAFCSNLNFKALLLEYLPQGSLEKHLYPAEVLEQQHGQGGEHLHQTGIVLPWSVRFDIAVDVARGMTYLHHNSPDALIHGDLKPSNILLDDNMVAKVADFGISRVANLQQGEPGEATASKVCGTPGYMPPEYAFVTIVSTKGDVFSYGVVLLEMLSKRSPQDTPSQVDYRNWNLKRFHDNPMEMFDPVLQQEASVDALKNKQMGLLAKVGFFCTQENPQSRPSMEDVLSMLHQIQELAVEGVTRKTIDELLSPDGDELLWETDN